MKKLVVALSISALAVTFLQPQALIQSVRPKKFFIKKL